MRRFISAFCISSIIIVSIVTTAHASNSYYWVANPTSNVIVEYDALCTMCADAARLMGEGYFSNTSAAKVNMYYDGYYYCVRFLDANNNVTGYLGANSQYAKYVAYPTANNYLADIKTACTNIYSVATSINTRLNNILNAVEYIFRQFDDIIYCGYVNDSSHNPFPVVNISGNTRDDIIANLNAKMVDRKITYVDVNNSNVHYTMMFTVAYPTANGYIAIDCYDPQSISSYYTYYLCDKRNHVYKAVSTGGNSTYDDSAVIDAISELGVDLNNTVYATSSRNANNVAYSTTDSPYTSVYSIVNYLNEYMVGRNVRVFVQDTSTSGVIGSSSAYVERPFMWARLGSPSQDVTIVNIGVLENNSIVSYVLCTPSRYQLRYRTDYDATFRRYDSIISSLSSLKDSVDAVYDWLDNADLATNETIIQVGQQIENTYESFDSMIPNVLEIYDRSFGRIKSPVSSLVNLSDIFYYFDTLWEDGE